MVAQLDDQPSRLLVDTAIAALSRMTHRGGVAADGLTGDGCGLLLRRPDAFLKLLASEAGIASPRASPPAWCSCRTTPTPRACRTQLQAQVAVGCKVAGWREVPTDDSVCGQLARDTLPRIEQVFVDAGIGQDDAGFALALFLARRRSEQQLRDHAISTSPPSPRMRSATRAWCCRTS
jgi:glutamate synthase (NADPH/NADH) large chain